MNLPFYRLVVLSLLTTTPALAQSYAAQISALQPLSASASYGIQSSNQTLPAGQLPTSGALAATAYVSSARFNWNTVTTDTQTSVSLNHFILALTTPGNPGAGALGPNELLIEFQPTGSPTATLEVTTAWSSLSGPAPSVQIDLGNDGIIDRTNPNGTVTVALPVGQVYQVRVVLESALPLATPPAPTVATNSNSVTMTVRPSNNILTSQTVNLCGNAGAALTLEDAFPDRGIAIGTGVSVTPAVLVIGFTPLVALLPITASLPCILLPQPDVVMLLPPQGSQLLIPLPTAVRPATFHVQSVTLSQQADLLGVSPGYTVIGQ